MKQYETRISRMQMSFGSKPAKNTTRNKQTTRYIVREIYHLYKFSIQWIPTQIYKKKPSKT